MLWRVASLYLKEAIIFMLRQYRIVLLTLLLLLTVSLVNGATIAAEQAFLTDTKPYYQHHRRIWNTQDGLPQISVLAITQDLDGYMWLATEGGLAQFDGHQFTVFNAANTPLFTNPLLRSLLVTTQGELLVGSSDKLIIRRDGDFSELQLNGKSVGNVESLVENAQQQVFIAAQQLLVWQDDRLSALPIPQRAITSLVAVEDKLWIGGPGYLALWQQDQYQLIYEQLNAGWVIQHLVATEDGLLLGTTQGLWHFNATTKEVTPAKPAINDEVLLLFKQQDIVWVATYSNLYQIKADTIIEKLDYLQHADLSWIVSAYLSKEGFLWFGSKSHGLIRLRADATSQYNLAVQHADPYVWALQEHQGRLVIGHNSGLASFDGKTIKPLLNGEQLSHPVAYSLFKDVDDSLWVGTRRGLNHLNADLSEVRRFPTLDHIQINGVARQADGSLWIATFDGLYVISPRHPQPVKMNEQLGLAVKRIRMVFVDAQDRLWIATSAGAFVLEDNQLSKINDPLLSEAYITLITQLSDGRILLGTLQHGFAFEDKYGSWQKILPEYGLPSADVIYLAETTKGLFVSNFNGVYHLDSRVLHDGQIMAKIVIDDKGAEAGVDGYRCCNGAGNSKGALWQDKLYLPTLNGLVGVDVQAITPNRFSPQPIIEHAVFAGQKARFQPLITLAPTQRDIIFSFTSPVYYRPQALLFRYRLKGFEQEWVEVNDRRKAFYTNLPAGNFTFQVQVRYEGDGSWSEIAAQPILLKARWYEQPWFYLILLLMALTLLYLFYRIWLQRLARQQQQLERMVRERTYQLDVANQQLAALNQRLQQQSVTDALTGLHNRHYLQQIVDTLFASAQRQQRSLHCLLIDLDNFKQINDTLGHQAGDLVLQQMARLLKRLVRQSDHVIRWGGEEFLLLMDSTEPPALFLERLLAAMQQEPWLDNAKLPGSAVAVKLSCSVGVVTYPFVKQSHWNWPQALVLADKALYHVKYSGKSGWLWLVPNSSADDPRYWLQQSVLEMLSSSAFDFDASAQIKQKIEHALFDQHRSR